MIQIPVNISLAIPQQGRDTRNFVSLDGFTGLSRTSLWLPFLLFNFVASQLIRRKSYYLKSVRHSANCPYLNERAIKNRPSKIFSSLLALSNINFSVSTGSTSIWLLSEGRLMFFSSMIDRQISPSHVPPHHRSELDWGADWAGVADSRTDRLEGGLRCRASAAVRVLSTGACQVSQEDNNNNISTTRCDSQTQYSYS